MVLGLSSGEACQELYIINSLWGFGAHWGGGGGTCDENPTFSSWDSGRDVDCGDWATPHCMAPRAAGSKTKHMYGHFHVQLHYVTGFSQAQKAPLQLSWGSTLTRSSVDHTLAGVRARRARKGRGEGGSDECLPPHSQSHLPISDPVALCFLLD